MVLRPRQRHARQRVGSRRLAGQACGDASLSVTVASSEDGITFGPSVAVRSGVDVTVANGRYLKTSVTFKRSTKGESPVLYEIAVGTADYVLEPLLNGAPTVDAGRSRSLTHPDPVRVTGSACDDGLPTGAPLALAWSRLQGPGEVTFADPAQEATDVTFSSPGTYVLRLAASDGELASEADVTLTVLAANQPPEVSASGPTAVSLPEAAELEGRLSDDGLPEGGTLTATWTKVSGPGAVTFANPQAPSTTASFSAPGAYVLRLTASDGHLSRTAEVSLVANAPPPVNAAPVVSAGVNQSVALGVQATLQGSVRDDGLPTGATVRQQWSRVSGPGTVSFTSPTSAVTRASFSAAGTYVLRLSATDTVLAASADVLVAVGEPAPENRPPQVSAGPNLATSLPRDTVQLLGSVADDGLPAGSNLEVTWTQVSGPPGVQFGDASEPSTTARFPAAGTYVLRLGASDSQFLSWAELAVVVSPPGPGNNAPVVTVSSSRSITLPTRTIQFSGSAQDDGLPTGSTLRHTWSVVSGPAGLVFGSPTQPSTSVSVVAPGTYQLRLSVTDGVLTGAAETTLTVHPKGEANQPPAVDAGPAQVAMQPAHAVALTGSVSDDGRPTGVEVTSTWRVVSGPGEVTFAAQHPTTTAAFSRVGDYVLELSASDSEWRAFATTGVRVVPFVENRAPVVAATGPASVSLADAAFLTGSVRDDGLPASGTLAIAWSLVSGPGPASFTRPAQASTAVRFDTAGDYVLRLTADDGEHRASADVTLRVVRTNLAPVVSAGPSQLLVHPERTAVLAGSATDDGFPEGSALSVAWSVVQGPGSVAFADADAASTVATFSYPGDYLLRLTAADGERTSHADTVVQVGAPSGTLPVVTLDPALDGATIEGLTPIAGTISAGSWRVEACPGAGDVTPSSECTELGSGSTPVSGTLATFDPSLLLNGTYTIRVTATTTAGTSAATASAVVEGELKLGNFSVAFTDLSVPVMGLPIDITRTYDSRDKRVGDFGHGWNLGVRNVRVEKSGRLGRFWEQTRSSGPFPTYCVRTTKPTFVTITFPSGKVYRFRATVAPDCQFVYPVRIADLTFEPEAGTRGELVAFGASSVFVQPQAGIPGPAILSDFDLSPIDPSHFQLTTEDGFIYELDEALGVRSVRDRNGNFLVFSRNGIAHSSGASVVFQRDTLGRITRITDPAGNSQSYTYDARGDLVAFIDREGASASYTYDRNHHLLTIVDPLGNQPVRNEYDEAGRLVRQIDPFGNSVEFTLRPGASQQVVTDRLGNATVLEHDGDGNVVRESRADGSVVERTYDARGNQTSETDPLGHVTRFAYDANDNLIGETDAIGNVTRVVYDGQRRPLTVTDALGRISTQAYDTRGNLTSTTDPLGAVTRLSYTSQGSLLRREDALGCVTGYVHDANGRLLRETGPSGEVTQYSRDANGNILSTTLTRKTETGTTESLTTQYTYDRSGRLSLTTQPDGSTIRLTYDALGNEIAREDARGHVTRTEYDELGRPVRTVYPDGTAEARILDPEGRPLSETDRAGRTTQFAYDNEGRLLTTTSPDGTVVASTYDRAGRLTSTTDARGQVTTHVYDAMGRRTRVVDALGAAREDTYDAVGNLLSETDAAGRTTHHEYDALNRRVRTRFTDGTERRTGYDALGRVILEVDPEGRETHFAYDCSGRLIAVTDALGGITRFTYDELGRRTSMTDAEGRVVRHAYDLLGREILRTLPTGESESRAYDPNGNLTRRLGYGGRETTFAYDSNDRLTERVHADGTRVQLTYGPTGVRETVTDARGTTRYVHDAQDRLVSLTSPDGTSLAYAYDADGNRSRLVARTSGLELVSTYAYDALGRLQDVTDPEGRRYVLTHDSVGNRSSLAFPNGVTTTYAYDSLNRLTSLSTGRTDGTLLLSHSFTLAPSGVRTRIDEANGTTRTFSYDALYRLTGESVAGGTRTYSQVFAYDAVGNRVGVMRTDASGTTTRLATFDARDRLLSDGPTTSTWSAEGQLLSRSGDAAMSLTWSAAERLERVVRGDGAVVEYDYDVDGNVVETRTTAPGTSTSVVRRFLVDPSGPLSHVVAELDGGGAVTAHYTRANDELLSVWRPGGTRYFHLDGLGSVRSLSDEAGHVTDTYDFSAFGELLEHVGSDPNAYLFAGEPTDPGSGFSFNRERWLDPGTGRFLSVDPHEPPLHDPRELHRYVYARNDVVNRIDPSGRMSLGSAMAGISVQVTLFTMRHSFAMGAIGFVVNVLLPEEVHMTMMNSGFAPAQGLGAAGQGTARVLSLMKGPIFRRFIKQAGNQLTGKLWNAAGHGFEEFARKYLFPNARSLKTGRHVVDFFYRGALIELKTGAKLGARELRQLKEFSSYAKDNGCELVYLFLREPDPATAKKIWDAGGKVVSVF